MNIKELNTKWQKEKDFYKVQEVGSGVQIFVKEILKSEEIFALKEGLKSTPLEKRKNEFLEEEKTKAQRKADIIVFISSEIVIPVEVEKYQNIEAGKGQLFNYQADLNKKYGILTDGFTWRFYNNNVFREFGLKQILDTTEFFLEFWKEYIKPEFYYLSFFEPITNQTIGKQSLFTENKLPVRYDELPVEQNLDIFFKDITYLIKSFNFKLQIEGYFENLDNKTKKKKTIEITYAHIVQFILYKTLVDNDFGEFKKEFENIVTKIHQYLKEKRYKDILGIIDSISTRISKNIYRPFIKEQEFIRNKLTGLYQKFNFELSDASIWLDIFVFIKKYNFANIQNEIFGYVYENYLKELYEEKRKGQYFTDPAVVNFMLNQIGFTSKDIMKRYKADKNSISLIDPACGSGTFLYSAVNQIIKAFGNSSKEKSEQIEEIVNNDIFGLDIEEFPLYLAEMNILMRMLHLIINEKYNDPVNKKIKVFKTRDSIAEFLDPLSSNDYKLNFKEDVSLGYDSYVREESDLKEMKKSMEKLPEVPRRRFDYVIGNPPYVSFKECSKQKILFFELIKKRKLKLNNVYGLNLHSIPNNPKHYAPNPNLYAFFIALGIALLKTNGKLCYIIPQTVLTAGDLDVIRYHLAKFTTIEKIIIFSGKMFIGRGLKQNKPVPTSSLIFVLSREKPSKLNQVEVINYEDPNDTIDNTLQNILDGKKISKKEILQNELLDNVANWNFVKQSKGFLDFYEEYKKNTDDMHIYYYHDSAEQKFESRFYFDRGVKYPKDEVKDISKLTDKDFYYVSENVKNGFRAIATDKGISKNLLDFPFGSQGDAVYQKNYKIVWSYMNYDKFRFSKDKIVIDYNNVLISSDNKLEIFYLLSLLNSKVSISILEGLLRSENEKDILIGIKSIKKFIRVPKIVENNQLVKEEIIKQTEELLTLEEKKLSDFVDFSSIMLQKFNKVSVIYDNLILEKEKKAFNLPIRENKYLVQKIITERYGEQTLDFVEQKISLSELKELPMIDCDKQQKLKDYIDDLVFALYFNVPLHNLGLDKAEEIKSKCTNTCHYKLVSKYK